MVSTIDEDPHFFDIVNGVFQGDTLAPYLFITSLDDVLRMTIDLKKESGLTLKKPRSRRYPAVTITDTNNADDIVLPTNTPPQAESLLHSLRQEIVSISLHVNTNKMENLYFNWEGAISTLNRGPLKIIEKLM